MALVVFDEEGFDKALASDTPMMVFFGAKGCGNCRIQENTIDFIVHRFEADPVIIGTLDVDEHLSVALRYSIMSVPTAMLFLHGEETARIVGLKPYWKYRNLINEVLQGKLK